MSSWRQKAIDCAPELRKDFEDPDLTPYTVFMELLPVTIQAHIDNNNERLQKIYDFAAWCLQQKDEKLWNAAGVSFYEHLADSEETFSRFTKWITKDIYAEIRDLLNQRTNDAKMKKLDSYYGFQSQNRAN